MGLNRSEHLRRAAAGLVQTPKPHYSTLYNQARSANLMRYGYKPPSSNTMSGGKGSNTQPDTSPANVTPPDRGDFNRRRRGGTAVGPGVTGPMITGPVIGGQPSGPGRIVQSSEPLPVQPAGWGSNWQGLDKFSHPRGGNVDIWGVLTPEQIEALKKIRKQQGTA